VTMIDNTVKHRTRHQIPFLLEEGKGGPFTQIRSTVGVDDIGC